jgi:hypothetical protein
MFSLPDSLKSLVNKPVDRLICFLEKDKIKSHLGEYKFEKGDDFSFIEILPKNTKYLDVLQDNVSYNENSYDLMISKVKQKNGGVSFYLNRNGMDNEMQAGFNTLDHKDVRQFEMALNIAIKKTNIELGIKEKNYIGV